APIHDLVGLAQAGNDFGAEPAAAQAFDVDAHRPARVARAQHVGGHVLHQRAVAAGHAVRADLAERVHAGQAAHDGPVAHMHAAAQLHGVGQDRVVADMAVVRDMHIGHDPVVIAQRRDAAVLHGARVEGGELAHHIAVADHQAGGFAGVLFVLRHAADGAEPVEAVILADRGDAVQDAMRADFRPRAYRDAGPHDAIWANPHAGVDLGGGIYDGGGMDVSGHLGFQTADGAHELGLGHDLAVDQGLALVLAD